MDVYRFVLFIRSLVELLDLNLLIALPVLQLLAIQLRFDLPIVI